MSIPLRMKSVKKKWDEGVLIPGVDPDPPFEVDSEEIDPEEPECEV
jgi:hypothetical protein